MLFRGDVRKVGICLYDFDEESGELKVLVVKRMSQGVWDADKIQQIRNSLYFIGSEGKAKRLTMRF